MRIIQIISLSCAVLLCSCTKEDPFQQEHLNGHYVYVDYRSVTVGPATGNAILGGAFDLLVDDDKSAMVSGSWETSGTAIGLNLRLAPTTVKGEDGAELRYEFGLVEGNRMNYMLKGRYTVSGTVKDKDTGGLVPYEATGLFDARRCGDTKVLVIDTTKGR